MKVLGLLVLLTLAACSPEVVLPENELPIVTHWENGMGFSYLASDAPNVERESSGGVCDYVWDINGPFLPDYESYVGMDFTYTKITPKEAMQFADDIEKETGTKVVFLQPDALERMQPSQGVTQVVSGVLVDGSLITIMLPPNWDPSARSGTYPIIGNGYYDLNFAVFDKAIGRDVAKYVSLSGQDGKTGAIGFVWNGGGAQAGTTLNRNAYDQFAAIMDLLSTLGGDKETVLMYGGSRGGHTAMVMASNPYDHDYTVVYAAASAASGLFGTAVGMSSPTYPHIYGNIARATGFHDSWKNEWTYPDCGQNDHLVGLSAEEATLHIILGEKDRARADELHSGASAQLLESLKREGTKVAFDMGTHDKLPYFTQLQYARAMEEYDIPLQVDVVMRTGHGGGRKVGGETIKIVRVWEELQQYIGGGDVSSFTPGWNYYRVDRESQAISEFTTDTLPFTVDFPSVAWTGSRFPVVATGEPGTRYGVEVGDLFVEGVIDDSATAITWVTLSLGEGTYEYTVEIQKPDEEWQTLPATNTPAGPGVRATLQVFSEEPGLSGDALSERIKELTPHLSRFEGSGNWGIAEH